MTEIDVRDEGTIEVLPPHQTPSLPAQQMLRAHAGMMQDAWDLADKMCATTMVPTRFFRKPEDGTAAILYGSELGLNPIQSLQRVIPIHGMPTIEGRTMQALLQSRGYKFRWVEKSDERCELIGWDPKDPESVENPERSVWTIERAIRAEYVPTKDSNGKWKVNGNGKLLGNMKYITDPQAMLKSKCQAEVSRDLAPDVLLGIAYSTEELESENFAGQQVTSERVAPAPSAPITADEIMGDEPEPAAKPKRKPKAKAEPKQEPVDVEEVADPAPSDSGVKPEPAQVEDTAPPQQPDPIEPDPEGGPAGDQTDDERGHLIRKLFALLGKGDVTDREDRLIIYRGALKRPEISSTNDLSDDDLRYVISGLEAHDRKGDLAIWAEGWLIAAVEAETAAAQAAAATTTEGN